MKLRDNLYFYQGASGFILRRGVGTCNTVVIGNKKLLLVDPGVSIEKSFKSLRYRMTQDGLNLSNVELMMFTHVHFDHSNAASWVQDLSKCRIRTHPNDLLSIENPTTEYERIMLPVMNSHEFPKVPLSWARFFTDIFIGKRLPAKTEQVLCNHEKIQHEGLSIEVIFTPGHTSGHITYYIPEYKALIGGDIIVREHEEKINPGGCVNNMDSSLDDILTTLELLKTYDVELYIPGHGEPLEGKKAVQDLITNHMTSTINQFDRVLSLISPRGSNLNDLFHRAYPNLPFVYNQIKKIEIFLFLQHLCQQKRLNCIDAPRGRRWTLLTTPTINP